MYQRMYQRRKIKIKIKKKKFILPVEKFNED